MAIIVITPMDPAVPSWEVPMRGMMTWLGGKKNVPSQTVAMDPEGIENI